jgi:hypothetical protein
MWGGCLVPLYFLIPTSLSSNDIILSSFPTASPSTSGWRLSPGCQWLISKRKLNRGYHLPGSHSSQQGQDLYFTCFRHQAPINISPIYLLPYLFCGVGDQAPNQLIGTCSANKLQSQPAQFQISFLAALKHWLSISW